MTYDKKLKKLKERLEDLQVEFEHQEDLSWEEGLELRGRILELTRVIVSMESN